MSAGYGSEADEFDVVIVGLGPTGLTLAHLLGRRGLRVIALEREPSMPMRERFTPTTNVCVSSRRSAWPTNWQLIWC
jgi:2-polyprenyl-6-methoxyphenol hydroxylase-like FAD-dependent oxidoreductase